MSQHSDILRFSEKLFENHVLKRFREIEKISMGTKNFLFHGNDFM